MSLPFRAQASAPQASIQRMILSPFARILRRISPVGVPTSLPTSPTPLILAVTAALQRLELSRDPKITLAKLRKHKFTVGNTLPYAFMAICASYSWFIMDPPFLIIKLIIPIAYFTAVILPITSQFVLPATPVFAWLITFFCARYIPSTHRPTIHVALLPALESVLYGANISDLQTRYTNPFFDVLAWLPYGVLHFSIPFVVAAILWVFAPKGAVQYFGTAFGWLNLLGVVTQILFPCAAPWYEIIHGLTPAEYSMPGSPGGLLRIDRVFHSSGYTNTFGAAPLVFGAFPSLHSGTAVMEALFLSHFFPSLRPIYWCYVGTLWWATMYLSHHYLIDLTGGACLSVILFYATMPNKFKDVDQIDWSAAAPSAEAYELVGGSSGPKDEDEMDFEEEISKLENEEGEEEEAGGSTSKGKGKRSVKWGETSVLGEDDEGDVGIPR